ncbi:telomerase activating protein Est1 [Striga asiatica]|uniref:Telomerase activating protein Est1 n=1 Tax=Striga asiatica TaxID=4170 RepID=A0A5A7RIZ9_STRAF|nr:telomerase activating protein Est1 [Striga asiatica]
MTMLMDKDEKNSTRDRVQRLFNKNVELENKRRKAAQARIPSDPNTWQNMRENYEAIILADHDFSDHNDIEYALWQLHYRRIEELRALFNAALASPVSQNLKAPVRSGPDRLTKIRSQFKTFLSEASGFYHDLMLKIRAKYGLQLGYFSDDHDTQISISKDGNKSSDVKKGLISCHRCLIYLGDLARYKSLYAEGDSKARDFTAASSYYMQASSIWPSSGNPHHQLAILAGYSNDELLSIYRYFRSLAVENPFITARDNLIIAFEKNRQNYTQLLGDAKTAATVKMTPPRVPGRGRGKGDSKPSCKESKIEANIVKEKAPNNFDILKVFVTRFVRLNGILFTRTSLETFAEVFSLVKSDLLELLSSGHREEANFGSNDAECRLTVVRVIAILIFTVHNVNRESENQSYADILQRSVLLQNAFTATFEFLGCVIERCNQLSDPSSSYLLPGIMVFVEWLACHQDVAIGSEMEEKQVNARSYFWNKCIPFLNKLLSSGYDKDEDETCFSNMSKYDESETANRLALPEDFELRGFVPLLPAQLILDFSRKHSFGGDGGSKERMARVERIIAAGKALANIIRNGQESVYYDSKDKKFVFGVEPQDVDDYLLEPSLSDSTVDIPVEYRMASKMEMGVDDEDEDEVIVFRPPATEKHVNDFSSTLTTLGVPSRTVGFGEMDSRNENRSSVVNDSFLLHVASSAGLKLSDVVANGNPQSLQSMQPNTSNWSVEHNPIVNGLAHLNLGENGPLLKSELQEKFGVSQPTSFSMPYPQFLSTGNSQNHSVQIPQATMPSKLDSVMTSGVKPSTIMPPGPKKNPVSRPLRHFGPPPGFSSFPSKAAEELLSTTALKSDNRPMAPMDDYSWLDGYQLSSANQSVGFSSSMNQVGPTAFPSVSQSNGQMEIATFPFPGKQVANVQVQSERPKGWHDQFEGHMKQYGDHLRPFQNGNQQPGPPQQQYQGQSIWEGRFFV